MNGLTALRNWVLAELVATTVVVCSLDASLASGPEQPSASRVGQRENRWRYVWHNDRWWYWMPGEYWISFDGRRWSRYDSRRPSHRALAARYRQAPAFESPPAVAPLPPASWPVEAVRSEAGMINVFDLEGRPTGGADAPFGGALPALGGRSATGSPRGAGASSGGRAGSSPAPAGARTSGGGFGGPTGSSLGGGSATGPSSPH